MNCKAMNLWHVCKQISLAKTWLFQTIYNALDRQVLCDNGNKQIRNEPPKTSSVY